MEKRILVRQRQRALSGDFMDLQSGLRATLDELIRQSVGPGRYYTGYAAAGSLFELTLQPGRVYLDGAMYQSLSSTVFAEAMFNVRPIAQRRIVAVVGWGQEIETTESGAATEPRQFAVDAVNNVYEVQHVSTRAIRRAQIDLVSGVEAAQPEVPAIPNNTVLIATVLLGTGGIESVTMHTAALLPQSERNAVAIAEMADFLESQVLRIDTLVSDQAAIRQHLTTLASKSSVLAVRAIAEAALERANAAYALAENGSFLRDFEDRYADSRFSNPAAAGYAAVVDNGLRFPAGASSTLLNGIELFNALEPKVRVNNDLILPSYTHRLRLDTFGGQGKVARQAALQSFTAATHNVQATVPEKAVVTYTKATSKLVFSVPFPAGGGNVVLHGVSFSPAEPLTEKDLPLNSTTIAWALAEALRGNWGHNASRAQLLDDFKVTRITAKRLGTQEVRVYPHYAYAKKTATTGSYVQDGVTTYDGQGRSETWLQERDGWLTQVGGFFTSRGAAGDVRVLISAVDASGAPDLSQTPVNVTVPWADIKAAPMATVSPDGVETVIEIPPVLLSGGRRYAISFLSSGDHYVRMTEGVGQMTQGAHWALSDANKFVRPNNDPAQTMAFRLYFARFASTKTEVDLKPLSLAGGITDISVTAQMVTPDLTELAWEVQPDGTNWRVLGPSSGQRIAADLSGRPELLPFRVVFEGTHDIMPALSRGSAKSAVISSRPAGALAHQSINIDVGAGNTAEVVKVIHTLLSFDSAEHSLAVTLVTDPGGVPATLTPDAVTDTVLEDGSISRTSVFELVTGKQTFAIRAAGGTTGDIADLYAIGSVYAAFYSTTP